MLVMVRVDLDLQVRRQRWGQDAEVASKCKRGKTGHGDMRWGFPRPKTLRSARC